jgi:hypothetical protein
MPNPLTTSHAPYKGLGTQWTPLLLLCFLKEVRHIQDLLATSHVS